MKVVTPITITSEYILNIGDIVVYPSSGNAYVVVNAFAYFLSGLNGSGSNATGDCGSLKDLTESISRGEAQIYPCSEYNLVLEKK